MALTAQQRRKLDDTVRSMRCPTCRSRLLGWLRSANAVSCGMCAATFTPDQINLVWFNNGPCGGYWMASGKSST